MKISRQQMLEGLVSILGEAGVMRDAQDFQRYVSDWSGSHLGTPLGVVRPADTAQVAAVVRFCAQHGIPMSPQGGHTGLVGGALPDRTRPELVISLERLNRVRQLDPIGFTMTVDAGCVLEQVKQAAEAADCYFPLALGAQGSCQIGGNIATNAGGVNVLRYGMMRELVLGLEVVLPDGRVWESMNALRKDNRGYNLQQLFIGSEGTLGIVTGAVLKLSPRPQRTLTAWLAVASAADAVLLYTRARRECCELLSAFELVPRIGMELAFEAIPLLSDPLSEPHPFYVLLELSVSGPLDLRGLFDGFLERAMSDGLVHDGALASSGEQARRLWLIREGMVEGQRLRGEHLRTDVSVPISSIAAFVEQASQAVAEISPQATTLVYGHIGDGNLHFNILPPLGLDNEAVSALLLHIEDVIFAVLDRFNGSISAEHGIGRIKQQAYLSRMAPEDVQLLNGLKALFDPMDLMNAGRIVLPRARTAAD
ncbi:FAD-binding oxidoreductase [Pseudomonas sp. KSR10]|uniref:FAD-binding oxidoreductase n=1 Tax=Pseudomonas sp. KSR10 TaxID=2916654 RepID=UPI001EF7FB29|nr:FAD-binding oxidoreductase [Pseudomonas sp. KSR10]MCG6539004.1 FAD-binding oxidoreductase [Pseudomonas sp. KSR10]